MQTLDFGVRIVEPALPTGMGSRRRRMALTVALIGLATFFAPLVETDSEVLGQVRWSPFQVILAIHAGTLPLSHAISRTGLLSDEAVRSDLVSLGIDALLGVGMVYFLLTLIAGATVIFPSARFVGSAAALGAAWTWGELKWEYPDFQSAIYGAPPAFASGNQVHAGVNCLFLLAALGALLFIAATKQLD